MVEVLEIVELLKVDDVVEVSVEVIALMVMAVSFESRIILTIVFVC